MKLPDLNVWLAAVWAGHHHHPEARRWFDAETETIAFCRITQMGLLRLTTNPTIMREDSLNRNTAWDIYEQLIEDPRVTQTFEPDDFEKIWRAFSKKADQAHKLWTDDYLAAFAYSCEGTLVTFDQKLARRHPSVKIDLITTDGHG